jgi:pimeloyl-ACP methyl ester carboxylesterase
MRYLFRLVLLLALFGSTVPAAAPAMAQAAPVPGTCVDGTLPHKALSRICIPTSGWNGDLVVWVHGYVDFTEPIDFYHLELPDGTKLPDLIQGLGFAFATTSYRQNGLAILEGIDDIAELVAAFRRAAGRTPAHTYLAGPSEGGAVTALAIERRPELFSGGLSACGPIGDFKYQVEYVGDFRVLFDYFFPGVIPGEPTNIPSEVISNWDGTYVPRIRQALAANPSAARQLISTSKAATDAADPSTVATTTEHVLWYNVFGTNDAVSKLGGNPFGNRDRWYWGSDNDIALNALVKRFSADARALRQLGGYQTTGKLTRPLVTLHTTGDEVIPFWHQILYAGKASPSGGSLTQLPVFRYGHCNFTRDDALLAFGLLALQVTGSQPQGVTQRVDIEQARRDFERAQREVRPKMPTTNRGQE